ncbi:TIGR00341 family protein [Aulosira sp. FACHB-615]|uniref:TIGR00341 family protein n=1 Tax=Aulosira sp. FACHB-615 TaxID=2692777 RepID=UPI0016843FB0|nr:TIGR00341 family protein [Aulosira sp. FACHB-615]MBD2488649.1 TIGR00341 family protein [Aulosira sp. FACHB-615]
MINHLHNRFRDFKKRKVEPGQLQQLVEEFFAESTPNTTYLILIIGSCAIATFGLLSNSTAVIIGAMIIAPLMLPIRGLAFGALVGNVNLFRQGTIAVLCGTLLALLISYSIGLLVNLPNFGSEVLSRSKPTLLDLGIAVAAGGISGYAKVNSKISASVAGTAIAVALMPPICVIGLGLAKSDWALSLGATLLYLTNLLGISLACMLTFFVTGYSPFHHARKVLLWALALTGILLIPLTVSFSELFRQAQLETSLKKALLNRTVTFQRLELLTTDTNWLANPPEVRLSVRAKEPVTSKQVHLLEEFIKKEMGQVFRLVFEVSQVTEVRGETPNLYNKMPKFKEESRSQNSGVRIN